MRTAAIATTCASIETGTVYHFWAPILIDGFAISPNI